MNKSDLTKFGLLAVAILLLVLMLAYARFQQRHVEAVKEAVVAELFPDAKLDNVNYIRIHQGPSGDNVELVQQEGRWFVKLPERQFPASPDGIKDLLDFFRGVKPDRIASQSADDYATYDLTDDKAISVSMFQAEDAGEPELELMMGKAGPDSRSVFARKPASDISYLIGKTQATLWQRKALAWRDEYPLREKREDISAITVHSPGGEFTVSLDDKGFWQFADTPGVTVKQEAVVSLISRMTGLVGLELIDQPTHEHGLDKPDFSLDFAIGDRKVTLSFSPEMETNRFVRNSWLDQVYKISASAVQGLKLDRQEFVQPPKEEEAKAEGGKAADSATEVPPADATGGA
jgi:hypothetical protein